MKWKAKPSLKDRDEKTERRFAFFPVGLDNGIVVWLEYYYSESIYLKMDLFCGFWLEIKRYQ